MCCCHDGEVWRRQTFSSGMLSIHLNCHAFCFRILQCTWLISALIEKLEWRQFFVSPLPAWKRRSMFGGWISIVQASGGREILDNGRWWLHSKKFPVCLRASPRSNLYLIPLLDPWSLFSEALNSTATQSELRGLRTVDFEGGPWHCWNRYPVLPRKYKTILPSLPHGIPVRMLCAQTTWLL